MRTGLRKYGEVFEMKDRGIFWISCVIALGAVQSAHADFVATMNPGDSIPGGGIYTSATTNLTIPGAQFDILNSVSDANLTVNFSTPLQVLDVPDGWGSWSSPPFSESDTPRVLWTQGPSQVTLSLSNAVQTFGFEAQPDQFGPFTITANFFSGFDLVGSIVRDVDGDSGARLFAGTVTDATGLITSVQVSTGGQDFGIAQLRYALASPVPEPSTLVLGLMGILVICGGVASNRYCKRNAAA
jgi:hypothetical protein